jgi:hypothetical protein
VVTRSASGTGNKAGRRNTGFIVRVNRLVEIVKLMRTKEIASTRQPEDTDTGIHRQGLSDCCSTSFGK